MRPLDRFRSIKVKLSLVVVAGVFISAVINAIGFRYALPGWLLAPVAVALALLVVYPFSRGITAPLREMAEASRAMAEGDFTHPVTTTSRDEVGELARAFDQMRAELAEVERQRRALIANVSHELRTPLTSLRARFENIVDGVQPNDAATAAASLAEIERLSALVEQVLDLSRLESGAAPLQVEDFAVAELLGDAVVSAAPDGQEARVAIGVDGALSYSGDRGRLHQVVTNLVDNALRFSPPCSPVRVVAEPSGSGIAITVSDRGPGIDAAERHRVLERFYRTDDARSTAEGGTGLGLAIVSEIVDLHGGAIEIGENRPTGCRVVVRLPRSTDVDESEADVREDLT